MKYSTIGTTSIKISQIGFGCMSLEQNQEQVNRLLRRSYEHGINFYDTADLYDKGLNEEMVGKALKPIRDKVRIATKVGNVWREDGSGWDWNPTKEHILSAVDVSLRRLQTDRIDVYMLHGGTIEDPIDEVIEAFEQLKTQGKILAYGISSIRPNVIREYVKRSNIDCVMMQYSLLDRRPEESCLNILAENNISVLTRGSLAKGMLIDKAAKEYLGYSKTEVQKLQSAVKESGNPLGTALQYVLQHPVVTSAVTGIRTEQQLEDIIQYNNQPLTSESLQSIAATLPPKKYEKHR